MEFKYQRFPTNNNLDIPLLDITMQPTSVHPPHKTWGSHRRDTFFNGTYNFYTSDERFTNFQRYPEQLLKSGCKYVVEPNYSTDSQLDFKWNYDAIYWKRKIARYWQDNEVFVFVDLNVDRVYQEMNLLSVPKGYAAYANRAHKHLKDHNYLLEDYELAKAHTQKDSLLYLVFGGGPQIQKMCAEYHWIWIAIDR